MELTKPVKILLLIFLSFSLANCGKKGQMEYPGGQKKPDFNKVMDPGNNF